MAINFTDSPADGATQVIGGRTYTYNSTKNKWDTTATEVTGPTATVYATVDALPTSGNTTGAQAYVSGNNRLYIWNGTGWYNIALINTAPSISGVSSSYALAIDGTATTVTITASDPEGLPITYSIASDTSGNIATVTQSSNVFTITPSTDTANAGTFSLTFRASDGVNLATAVSEFTLQFKVTNSNYTTALITTSGSAGINTTFTDSSTNSHTITVNGDVNQNSFSPYRSGGYSAYFDGTGDYLSAAADTSFDFGSGDFTIEFWMYPDSIPSGEGGLVTLYEYGSNRRSWYIAFDGSKLELRLSSSGTSADTLINSASGVFAANNWYHVAMVREGNNITGYVNGASVATGTHSGVVYGNSTDPVIIGSVGTTLGGTEYDGYITDVRVVKGTAVYTAAFTPPEERLTAVTNTSLLTCHLPYIADGSTNNHTVTPNGNVATQPFGPYDYAPYAVGTHGGSAYFDGTSDSLSLPTSAGNLGTGDFTVELWAYHDDTTLGGQTYIDTRQTSGTDGWLLYVIGGGEYIRFYANGGNVLSPASAVVRRNAWNHIALTRASGTIRLFVNGKEHGSTSSTADFAAYNFNIGEKTYTTSSAIPMQGNISDVRISTNARYTTDFTPSTTPFTNDSNTQLLVNMQGAKIIDKAQGAATNLLISGNATASTAAYKYLPTSMYFDGTGDLIILDNLNETFDGDFTVEGWYKFNTYNTSGANSRLFASKTGNANAVDNFQLIIDMVNTPGSVIVWTNVNLINNATTNIADNNWHHVAVTREGTNLRLFIDGTQDGSTATTSQVFSFVNCRLGARDYTTDAGSKYTGYMSDVRITKGLARYTANFTPPSAALDG